jgi:hypothetical protein
MANASDPPSLVDIVWIEHLDPQPQHQAIEALDSDP